jgi:hypothetical protein
METLEMNQIVYAITIEDVQDESLNKIGRTLNEEEIDFASKALNMGIGTSIGIIYNTIFKEVIK